MRITNDDNERQTMSAGRFAPSPSGPLHVGNLRTAILAWLYARQSGRDFRLRIDDIDPDRTGYDRVQIEELASIGITWDGPILYQSTRLAAYDQALTELSEAGMIFECFCSRKDIRESARAPHQNPGHYPGTCLSLSEKEKNHRRESFRVAGREPAIRLRPSHQSWTITDKNYGKFTGPIDHLVLRRSDGVPAYNLATVIDDGFQEIDQVVRGEDLLPLSPAQSYLCHVLQIPPPHYRHVPLLLNHEGKRLAKRDRATTLEQLTEHGFSVQQVIALISQSLGYEDCDELSTLFTRFNQQSFDRWTHIWDFGT